jgi:hypothetical protein
MGWQDISILSRAARDKILKVALNIIEQTNKQIYEDTNRI